VSETPWANAPWEHPDWYDIHDTTWTAGPEREAEHYRELVIALPPLDAANHLLDAGCGTGKLAALIARGYPKLGRVTLLEPNPSKLERAAAKLRELLPTGGLGEGEGLTVEPARVVVVGSVLMPIMELRGGKFVDGLAWLPPRSHFLFAARHTNDVQHAVDVTRPAGACHHLVAEELPIRDACKEVGCVRTRCRDWISRSRSRPRRHSPEQRVLDLHRSRFS
jgi:SAM-dependent methyltransferase